MFETLFNLFRSVENIMNRRLTRIRRRFVHRVSIERNYCNQKILKATSLRNDAWNVGCDAAHVEIGYVVPPPCKNNIFWIFETATSRNYGKWMATCGMSDAHILKANKINSDFLFYSLVHKDIRKYVNGSTRSKLTKKDMKNLIIDLPRFEREQEEIVVIFSAVDKEINCIQNEIKQLKEQKRGLMQLLLTGIVRVEVD